MSNRKTDFSWRYHNSTKHTWESVRSNTHFLDWSNQPRPFKIYPRIDPIPLPAQQDPTGMPALFAITNPAVPTLHTSRPCKNDLASLLYYSAGITRRRGFGAGEILFRAAACTGALYSIELYLVCGELEDLDAGVYHFDPIEFALRRLRTGDHRGVLIQATADEPAVAKAPVSVVCTGTFWRNAWKYQARTYRHFGWDNGTILANLLATAAARHLEAKVIHGFIDDLINHLLGLDTTREVALNLIPIGHGERPARNGKVEPITPETLPYSHHEVDYPIMREMHAASSLRTPDEVGEWRRRTTGLGEERRGGDLIALSPFLPEEVASDSIEEVILRRGSTRRFERSSISFRQFSTILCQATHGVPADFLNPAGSQLNDLYVVCHAVDGVPPGAYAFHRNPWSMELLKAGDFRKDTGYLGLEQDLSADCSAAVFFLADLHRILEQFGNRGYRAAQLEAGIIGGRLYLASYAQRLGATGLTFYDDDVTEFFSPHAERKSAIFLVALGRGEKRRRHL